MAYSQTLGISGEEYIHSLFAEDFNIYNPPRGDIAIETASKTVFGEIKNLSSGSKDKRYQINEFNQKNDFINYYFFLIDSKIVKILDKTQINELIKGKKGKRIKISLKKVLSLEGLGIEELMEVIQ